MSRITAAFYDRTGTLLTEPEAWWPGDGLWLDELDDLGSFSINIQADDPDIGDITDGSIVVFSIDTVPKWRGVIRHRTIREVANDEAGRYHTLIGVGEAGRLDEMVVYPSGGLGRFPFSDDRAMDWTAPEFDDSGWDAVVVTPANYGQPDENYGLPEGFPDGDSGWIWPVDSSGSVAATTEYLRGSGTAVSTRVREAWGAADDTFETYLQGISSLRSGDTAYVGRTTAVELLISEGPITVAARVTNLNVLKAGFLFSLLTPLDDAEDPTVHTDDTWLFKPEDAPLGMNAGQVMNIWLDEAGDRGEDTPARTWTDALDSDGNPWEVYEQLTVSVGSSYLDGLKQMVDLAMCEFRMSPDSYELNLYNPGGAGTTVSYTLGDTNLTSLTWETVPALTTALLVRYGRGFTDTEDATLVTAHGRRVQLLALGGIGSRTAAIDQADKIIDDLGDDRVQVAATIDPENQASEPYTLYVPGDSITSPMPDGSSSAQRVKALAVGVDEAGNPTWTIHLNSVIAEQQKRQQIMLKRLANGSVGGRTNSATTPIQPRPIQPREPLEFEFSQPGAFEASISPGHTFTRAVRIREVHVLFEVGSSSGDPEVEFRKNGTTFATVIVDAGELSSYVPVSNVVFDQRVDVLTVEATVLGTGVQKATAKIVYA